MVESGLSMRGYAAHRRALRLPGVTASAVKKAIDTGRISTLPDGSINPVQADREWARNTSPAKQRAPGGGPVAQPDAGDAPATKADNGYSSARTVREVYAAKKARLAYEKEAGTLVAVQAVSDQAFKTGRAVRDAMLGIIPRLKAQLAATDDPDQVEQMLLAEIRLAIRGLAGE